MKKTFVRALPIIGLLIAAAQTARADEPPAAPASEGVVNLNTATSEQLQLLPGIGEAKARAIIELRQRRPFARVDDVVAVRGIGRATLRRLRPYLSIRGDTTLSRRVAAPAPRTAPQAAQPPAARHR